MFTVDHQANRISPVKTKSFSELGFTERKHLQEWLAYQPDALGEELLIIQKEFDGFDDTKERLDLLALDKDGNLVIIENKLDDSGRDVVWQALKYASYCASLTKAQVVDIFQQYIERYETTNDEAKEAKPNASARICEFLDAPDLDEVKLNLGNSQRLMLVAANFRKEVTSTALWLIGQGLSVQCFKVTPYSLGEQLLINIDQIIPTPEAKELMIGINAKEADEKSTEKTLKKHELIRQDYWTLAMEAFQASECTLYNNISPSKDHWLSAGSGTRACPFQLIFGKSEIRIVLNIAKGNRDENKFLFDSLYEQKNIIEDAFGAELTWRRMDDRQACNIQLSKFIDGYNRDNWPECIEWHVEQMVRFEKAMKEPLLEAASALKAKQSEQEPS